MGSGLEGGPAAVGGHWGLSEMTQRERLSFSDKLIHLDIGYVME